jgi:hypothetical protein
VALEKIWLAANRRPSCARDWASGGVVEAICSLAEILAVVLST